MTGPTQHPASNSTARKRDEERRLASEPAATCVAVIAEFAWFSQECREPAPHIVRWNGDNWPVCDSHFAAFNAQVGVL